MKIIRILIAVFMFSLGFMSCGVPRYKRYVPASPAKDSAYRVVHKFSIMTRNSLGKVTANKNEGVKKMDSAVLRGKVTDRQGRPVPQCNITVAELSMMHIIRSLETDSTGMYSMMLAAGGYDIEYAMDVHESVEIEKIFFAAGENHLLNVQMGDPVTYKYYEFWTKSNIGREEYFEAEKYVRHHRRYRIDPPKE